MVALCLFLCPCGTVKPTVCKEEENCVTVYAEVEFTICPFQSTYLYAKTNFTLNDKYDTMTDFPWNNSASGQNLEVTVLLVPNSSVQTSST